MSRIELATHIAAPIERCFDLSRSIDLQVEAATLRRVRAIRGVTSGLIGPQQEVTWSTRYFALPVTHTSRITEYDRPRYFQDSMLRGWFHSYCHDHHFTTQTDGTLMRDSLQLMAPLGAIGRIVEREWLDDEIRGLLIERNRYIQRIAESDAWKSFLAV